MLSMARLLPVRSLRLSSCRQLSSSLNTKPVPSFSPSLTLPPSQQPVVRGPLLFQPPPASLLSIARHFASGGGKDSVESAGYDEPEEEEDVLDGGGNSSIPSTETVPDYWPDVPVIAVNRHPVFPKFIKIVELNDEKL